MGYFVNNYDLINRAVKLGCKRVRPGSFSEYKYTGPQPLVVAEGDEDFPGDCNIGDKLPNLVFAQNYDGTIIPGTKVVPIPIGVDFHTIAKSGGWGEPKASWEEQEYQLRRVAEHSPPWSERIPRIWCDFQHADTMQGGLFKREVRTGENRTTIFHILRKTGLVDFNDKPLRRSELWKRKSQYRWTAAPHGHGLDTHRLWEDLCLGCTVLVRTSSLDNLYKDLPVICYDKWELVKEPANWPGDYKNPRLTADWWEQRMKKEMEVAA